jgi:hypothetical protein
MSPCTPSLSPCVPPTPTRSALSASTPRKIPRLQMLLQPTYSAHSNADSPLGREPSKPPGNQGATSSDNNCVASSHTIFGGSVWQSSLSRSPRLGSLSETQSSFLRSISFSKSSPRTAALVSPRAFHGTHILSPARGIHSANSFSALSCLEAGIEGCRLLLIALYCCLEKAPTKRKRRMARLKWSGVSWNIRFRGQGRAGLMGLERLFESAHWSEFRYKVTGSMAWVGLWLTRAGGCYVSSGLRCPISFNAHSRGAKRSLFVTLATSNWQRTGYLW